MSNVIEINQQTQEQKIDYWASVLKTAKNAEQEATAYRISVEATICEIFGVKPEGSSTVKGDEFSLTTTGKMTRSLIEDQLPMLQATLPSAIYDRLIRYKPSLDLKELRYIQANEPEMYREVEKAFSTKPAKPAVGFKAL